MVIRQDGEKNYKRMARTILVIEDEENMRWVLKRALEKSGYEVVTSSRGDHALKFFASRPVDLVLLDLKMPGMDGISVLHELRKRSANVPILLLTAYASVPTAVEAIKIGATDYIRKPFDLEDVLNRISRCIYNHSQNEAEVEQPANTSQPGFQSFIGIAPTITRPLDLAAAAAETEYTVLIQGEPGSGRRHLAKLIHQNCALTYNSPIVTIDCACLPLPLLEKELLDTNLIENQDAVEVDHSGRWQQALGGSLLLVNADALPEVLLNRLIEHLCTYIRTPQRPFGLRLILTCDQSMSAVWHSLLDMAITIELPPLRQRLDDLPLLLPHFAPDKQWSQDVKRCLAAYNWPGNISELKQVAQQAVLLARNSQIEVIHLPPHILACSSAIDRTPFGKMILPVDGIDLDALEKDLIVQALEIALGNKAHAARLLGMTRATLLYRIDKHELT